MSELISTPESAAPKQRVWVGFDLGGTKMLAVVFNDKLEILGKKRRKTRDKEKDGVQP